MDAPFDTSPFFSPDFDVVGWIAEQVGPIPRESLLEALRNDLGRCQAALKADLVSNVNKDYAGFVQLSSRIEGFNTAIQRFKAPLSVAHDRLRATQIALEDKLRVRCLPLRFSLSTRPRAPLSRILCSSIY